MRFERLLLIRYGHFTDFELDFGQATGGRPDLHVLYGANEAGKTTTLAAITDMLFGIERTTPWKFLHGNELLELQATLQQGTDRIEIKRFKKHWSSLQGERLERFPLDLQGLSREDYQRRFSFDEQTLQAGGEQILGSAGDVGQALFSASSGLADLKILVDRAMQSADRFWIPGRRKHLRLFALKEALQENKRQMDAVKLDTPTWKKRRAHLEQVTLRRDTCRQRRDQLQQQRDQLQRRQSAITLAERVQSLRTQLDDLGRDAITATDHPRAADFLTSSSTAHVLEQVRAQLQDCRVAREADAELTLRIEELQRRIQAVTPDDRAPRLMLAAKRIRTLADESAAVPEWQQQLSRDQLRMAQCDSEIDAVRVRLGLAADTALATQLPGDSQRQEWQALLDEEQALSAGLQHAREELERLPTLPDDADSPIEDAVPSAPDPAIAMEVLHSLQQTGLVSLQARARDDLLEARQELATLMESIGLTQEQFARLDLPERSWLEQKLTEITNRQQQRGQLQHRHDDRQQHILQADARRQSLTDAGAIDPSRLEQSLRTRDEAWSSHRQAIERQQGHTELQASATAFEQALRHHDELCQRSVANAETSSELRVLQRQRLALLQEQQDLDQQLSVCQQEQQHLANQLLDRVRGFYPYAQVDADTLRARHELALRIEQQQADTRALTMQLQKLELQAEEQRQRVLSILDPLLDDARRQTLATLSLEDLLAQAIHQVEAHRTAQGLAGERSRERMIRLQERESRQQQLKSASDRLTRWQKRWQRSTRDTLLADSTPAFARDCLSLLAGLSPLVQQRAEAVNSSTSLKQRLEMRESRLADLLEELDEASLADALEQLEIASSRIEQHNQLKKDLNALQQKRRDAAATHARSLQSIEAWRGDLGCDSESALIGLLMCTLEHRVLQERHHEAMRELQHVSGESLDESGIAALGQDHAAEKIARQLTAVEDQLADVNRELDEAAEQWGLARRDVDELGDDNQFAWLNLQRENLLLQISDEARQCAIARTGRNVLDAAMRRFRQEHQSAILSAAQQAFRTLTGGRYVQLLPREDDKGNEKLHVIDQHDKPRAVSELSTGTRYQLYLALRAAAYADYASQRTPLPFVADDIMESFDDDRAAAAFRVLAGMANKGQVIYMTHHRHLLDLARDVVGPDRLHIHHYP